MAETFATELTGSLRAGSGEVCSRRWPGAELSDWQKSSDKGGQLERHH